ncbi:MAG: arylesterase [Alphaproteobacteria bacterium]
MGDSLLAGYGLPPEEGFIQTLGRALADAGVEATLLDAAVSGDTTAGGRARIDWALGDKPTHAVVALGANDALRGLPPEAAKQNLAATLDALKAAGTPVLLVGMKAPRNWGEDYADAFDGLYPALAEEKNVALHPFLLEGVALNPALNQADGIHPNAAGVERIVADILPAILDLLKMEPAE